MPFYRLSDLIAHFKRTGNGEADPAMLAKMRAAGAPCYLQSAGGCWLLLAVEGVAR